MTKKATAKKKATTENEIEVNVRERDAMLKVLVESDNADMKQIAELYRDGSKQDRERITSHYITFGTDYIRAVICGDTEKAIELASANDIELLS